MTGMFKDWSVIPTLGAVSCPTLFLNGDDDEVPDSRLFYGIERASWVTLGSSSSMAFWEEPARGSVDAQGLVVR